MSTLIVTTSISLLVLTISYILWNDRHLTNTPKAALKFSPLRITPRDARNLEQSERSVPRSEKEDLPPKTGRRYIIVGGGGFLGAWIATKLLKRGENPHSIRLLDLHPPGNYAVQDAMAAGLQFVKVDITDAAATMAAFKLPWHKSTSNTEITIFHSAANIRFFERHPDLLGRSTRVNVEGTENVICAARAVGADVLVYTSSGSTGLHSIRLFMWPWERQPEKLVQVINDDDSRYPKKHEDFFSNYAVSKRMGELLVRGSDRLPTSSTPGKILRTGCIRPGNGVFGPRGDINCGAWLVSGYNPTWAHNVVQSFNYVENCAAAHLCYEARLVDLQSGGCTNPDIGGDAFVVADPGPPPTYGDLYTVLTTLTNGECTFSFVSPTMLMILAFIIEWYHRLQQVLVQRASKWARFLPEVKGAVVQVQPPIFPLVSTHMIFDDSRARLPPEKGGLGYTGLWTSVEGAHRTVEEFKSGIGLSDRRSGNAGIGFKPKFWEAKVIANKVDSSASLPAHPLPQEVSAME